MVMWIAIVALALWCGYLHRCLYRTLIICNRDAMSLNRLLKVIRKSGILAGKTHGKEEVSDESTTNKT